MSAQPFVPRSRRVQMLRALFALIAAAVVIFWQQKSWSFGLTVFACWAIATAIVLGLGARAERSGRLALLLAVVYVVAGVASALPPLRGSLTFWILVPIWALLAGIVELVIAIRQRRAKDAEGGDSLLVAILTLIIGAAVLVVPHGYDLHYFVNEAQQWFSLTGDIIAVGLFGGYLAVVAVFLGIAAFSPRTTSEPVVAAAGEHS
ncbi:MAG: DUF308 domain-containing protein [Microbacterium sp.]